MSPADTAKLLGTIDNLMKTKLKKRNEKNCELSVFLKTIFFAVIIAILHLELISEWTSEKVGKTTLHQYYFKTKKDLPFVTRKMSHEFKKCHECKQSITVFLVVDCYHGALP